MTSISFRPRDSRPPLPFWERVEPVLQRFNAGVRVLLSFVTMVFVCCSPITADDLLVTSCRFEPPLFDSFTANTKLSYSLSTPATVSVYILDQQRRVVKTIAENLNESKGSHSHGWKGDSDDTLFVTSGTYIGQVKTNGKSFEATVEVFHW